MIHGQKNIKFMIMFRSIIVRLKKLQTKFLENIKAHVLFSVIFLIESLVFYENVEKYYRAGQTIDDNMAHAHCTLDS